MFLSVWCPLLCYLMLCPDTPLGNYFSSISWWWWRSVFSAVNHIYSSPRSQVTDSGIDLWFNWGQLDFNPNCLFNFKEAFSVYREGKLNTCWLCSNGRIQACNWWWPSLSSPGEMLLQNETERKGKRTKSWRGSDSQVYSWSSWIQPCMKPLQLVWLVTHMSQLWLYSWPLKQTNKKFLTEKSLRWTEIRGVSPYCHWMSMVVCKS